jgi:hypothetical protein
MSMHPNRTAHRLASILLLLLSSCVTGWSGTIVVDLAGYVSSFGGSTATTVTSNSVVGPINNVPPLTPGTTTVIPEGTPFTARFTYNTDLMPAATNVDSGIVNGGTTFPTHAEQGAIQWTTFSVSLAGHTFDTLPRSTDAAPTAVFPQSAVVIDPLSYGNRVAYGDATLFTSEAFHGASSMRTSYFFFDPNNPAALGFSLFRGGNFHFTIYRSDFLNQPFLPAGPGIPESFQWADQFDPNFGGDFGFLQFSYGESESRTFQDGNDLLLEASFRSTSGLLRVTSAVAYEAPVPEPSAMMLMSIGLAALVARRRFR